MASRLLADSQFLAVDLRTTVGDFHLKFNIRLPASREAANRGETAPLTNCGLQAPTGLGNIPEEPERIEKVRFASSIRANDENPISQHHVQLAKIAPISQLEPRNNNRSNGYSPYDRNITFSFLKVRRAK